MEDLDCTSHCKLVEHGNLVTKVLTKHEIDEEKLIKFLILSCKNFALAKDENGRSALMLACSNLKPIVAEFLLNHGANVHQKDWESGWTALHRAIFYGNIENALLLKRYGASFDTFDNDFITPLQLVPYRCTFSAELVPYVFGKNKNYNLGIGNINSRLYPEQLKSLPNIRKASVNKYHSLFLSDRDSKSKLFGCGISKEGRLGIGSEATVVNVQEIPIKFNHRNDTINDLSAGLHHSLILTEKTVYGCGSNKHFQLGLRDVERALSFTEIHFDRTEVNVTRLHTIIACDYHSVFANNQGVYICGLNLGQFGGIQESVTFPRKLANPAPQNELQILWVQSNNCCICVYAATKEAPFLTIYYNRKVKSYKNPMMEELKICTIIGGEMLYNSDEISKNSSQKPLMIVLMTQYKNLYIWYEDIMQFVKVHVSPLFTEHLLYFDEFYPCGDGILMRAQGQLFQGNFQHKVSKMYHVDSEFQEFHSKRDVAQFQCSKMTFKRLPCVANVSSYSCDVDGESFIAVMDHRVVKVPTIKKEIYDFSSLLNEFEYESSGILDVTIKVGHEEFKVNKLLISSRCELLKNLINASSNNFITLDDIRLTPAMFKCILIWIYKNKINKEKMNEITRHTKEEKVIKKLLQDFHDIAVEWNLNGVFNEIIENFPNLDKRFDKKINKAFRWFNLDDFPELCDVTILLDENQKLKAHKVILMMRIEYFKMMFYHCWSEDSVVDLKHISINFMRPIIQFAYDNDINALKNSAQNENFIYNMIAICDQYLIENMKLVFETMICERLTLRNCAENLEFSITYNCHVLKKYCMEFICLNLARLLESTTLDSLESSILRELSIFYREWILYDVNYTITPAFDVPTEEEIDEKIKDFNLEHFYETVQKSVKKVQKTPKNRPSKSELSKRNYEKEGVKELQKEIREDPLSPKTPDSITSDLKSPTAEDKNGWHKKERERKDSAKRKLINALKCNDIVKNEPAQQEPMIDLKSLKIAVEEEAPRSVITLADFGIKTKKKILFDKLSTPTAPPAPTPEVKKIGWNMDNIELKPVNSSPFDIFKDPPSSSAKKKQQSPKPSTSSAAQNKFASIVKNEKKEKEHYEKIKSKSLILTQIEERAITELSNFYNISKIFDEDIKIGRKVQIASQNLSAWHGGAL